MLNETSQTQKERYYVILQVLEGRRGGKGEGGRKKEKRQRDRIKDIRGERTRLGRGRIYRKTEQN